MNKIVVFSIGILMAILGILLDIPAIVDAVGGNPDWKAFVISSGLSIFLGVMMMLSSRGHGFTMTRRDGYLLTVGSWISLSLMAALPFWISNQHITFTDAVFEAISGLTTTGSTVLSGLDNMPPGLLLWRAMLQWIGGVGIVVMAVTLLPFLRVGGMQLYRMETSDQYDKIAPRIADVCMRIVSVYVTLTIACGIVYWLLGMTGFEASVHAMTTLSTGGFSTSDQSIGHFAAPGIEWAAVVFMLAGSLPFSCYIRFLRHFDTSAFTEDSQAPAYLAYTAAFSLIFAVFLAVYQPGPFLDELRLAAFNVVSIVTTTGYASGDYLNWGVGAAAIFFVMSLIGGCAGSTSGGLKAFRLIALTKGSMQQGRLLIHPHRAFPIRLGARRLGAADLVSVYSFFFITIAVLAAITLALAASGLDFTTAVSAAVTSIANVGPGLGDIIGPSGTFGALNDTAKWIIDIGMLSGRLEFLTVLVLFLPGFWADI